MSALQALVLGIVQGLSEFLPISSSGHLILVPWLLGWQNADSLTDVLAAIERAAHAHEGRTVGQTAPRGPRTPAPVSTPGQGPWLGGGLELSPP